MIFQIEFGKCWSLICLDVRGHRAEMRAITASSSTLYSGFCVRALLGAIYRPIMEIGKILTGAFVVGGTREFGKGC
jgi:hypothetical protein